MESQRHHGTILRDDTGVGKTKMLLLAAFLHIVMSDGVENNVTVH